jgi:hypothetical protein
MEKCNTRPIKKRLAVLAFTEKRHNAPPLIPGSYGLNRAGALVFMCPKSQQHVFTHVCDNLNEIMATTQSRRSNDSIYETKSAPELPRLHVFNTRNDHPQACMCVSICTRNGSFFKKRKSLATCIKSV